MLIKDFYDGQTIQFVFGLLQDIQIKTTAAGKPYLAAKLQDKSGIIDVKYWDYSGALTAADSGKIVKAAGLVSMYKDSLQFTLNNLRLANETDQYNKADLVPCAPIDLQCVTAELEFMLSTIKDEDYKNICNTVWSKYRHSFIEFPAAKGVHHAFIGGLLMHTFNMMRIAAAVSNIYKDTIDADLLLTGTFLHDLAKMWEYKTSDTGLAQEYTKVGHLVGHLVMGSSIISDLCTELNVSEDKTLLLVNMILSHHGKPEYGAAVLPKSLEAELLHMIDLIDSRVEICRELFTKTDIGQFSEKCFALDNKQMYRHK